MVSMSMSIPTRTNRSRTILNWRIMSMKLLERLFLIRKILNRKILHRTTLTRKFMITKILGKEIQNKNTPSRKTNRFLKVLPGRIKRRVGNSRVTHYEYSNLSRNILSMTVPGRKHKMGDSEKGDYVPETLWPRSTRRPI